MSPTRRRGNDGAMALSEIRVRSHLVSRSLRWSRSPAASRRWSAARPATSPPPAPTARTSSTGTWTSRRRSSSRVIWEFAEKDRAAGWNFWLTLAMPLGG